jgi:hypothetical protein
MLRGHASLVLLSVALACVEQLDSFENQLVLGTLDADHQFVPYSRDSDGRYLVDVVRGLQGADMVVTVVELPAAYAGDRVDLSCWIETDDWSSREHELVLDGVLVPNDRQLYAPYLILGWWSGQPTEALLACETSGSQRMDLTTLDARLVPAMLPP